MGGSMETVRKAVAVKPSSGRAGSSGRTVTTVTLAAQSRARVR
jgi:hypothetical protein